MSSKRRGLGKGLNALFEAQAPIIENKKNEKISQQNGGEADFSNLNENSNENAVSIEKSANDIANSVIYIDINNIKPNENQPRKIFDEDKIEELSQSILEHGIIQPLVLRKLENGTYEIVAGERRWRASRKAGLKKVPSIVREFTDEENMVIAIIENMQREDLNPIEEAEGLRQMIDVYGFTQEQVSKSVSKSRPYITNSLRLLNLPEFVRNEVVMGNISSGHGRTLLSVDKEEMQIELCKKVVKEGLSVRKLEEIVSGKNKAKKKALKRIKNPDIVRVENDLKEIFGTKVNIAAKGKKGVIELEYYNEEELNRLIDILKTLQ